MSEAPTAKVSGSRISVVSWGVWAELATIRALEIDPMSRIHTGLLSGQPTSHVALTIARAVSYLAGTQSAPDLSAGLRAWIDRVGTAHGINKVTRLCGLSWGEWASHAAFLALEIPPEKKLRTPVLHGQPVWEAAITVARAIGCLARVRQTWSLPAEVRAWLEQLPRPMNSGEQVTQSMEDAR